MKWAHSLLESKLGRAMWINKFFLSCNSQLVFLPQYQNIYQARLWSIFTSRSRAFDSSWIGSPSCNGYCQDGRCTNCIYYGVYLDPSVWQTLHQFLMSNAAVLGHGLLEKGSSKHRLQAQKMRNRFMEIFVTNNIMLLKDSPRESLDLRVVDFDWAGRGGEREKKSSSLPCRSKHKYQVAW